MKANDANFYDLVLKYDHGNKKRDKLGKAGSVIFLSKEMEEMEDGRELHQSLNFISISEIFDATRF